MFAVPTKGCTAVNVITALDPIFTQYTTPAVIHSDNRTQFTSEKFENYLLDLGIHHTFSCPYTPTGSSQAERYVGYVYRSVKIKLA